MKTIKNLIGKICTFPNAIKAYMKARKCKRLRPEVLEFEQNREDNLQKAIDAIQSGDYTPGKYRIFKVWEPKERIIMALPFFDRVIQHMIVNIIEKKLMEDDYTSLDLAAALLKMSMGDDNEDIIDNYMPARSLDDLDSYGRNSRGRDRGRNSGRRKGATDRAAVDYVLNGGEERMARLFINIGKSQRVTPGDILGAVAGESGIPGRLVGSIDMYDGYTFVDVPAEYAEDVLNAMSHARIKGKHIHVEKANSKR